MKLKNICSTVQEFFIGILYIIAAILIFTAIAIGVISLGIYALIKFSDILWPFYVFFGVVCLVRFIYIKLREKSKDGKISIWSNLFVNTK